MIRLGSNGTVSRIDTNKKETALWQAQQAVGGYVEQVHVPRMPGLVLLVNEDGRAHGLPINPAASAIVGRLIVGDVVLAVLVPIERGEDDEDGGQTWK